VDPLWLYHSHAQESLCPQSNPRYLRGQRQRLSNPFVCRLGSRLPQPALQRFHTILFSGCCAVSVDPAVCV
jgi:hypothetical protein